MEDGGRYYMGYYVYGLGTFALTERQLDSENV